MTTFVDEQQPGHGGSLCSSAARMLRCSMRFEDDHPKVGKCSHGPLDASSDFLPAESAETRTERGYGYRINSETMDLRNECHEPCIDILQARPAPPVTLGREVDDVAWWRKLVCLEYEHPSGLDLAVTTRRGISSKILRPRLLELQCDAGAHVPDTVDRVDKSIGLLRQQISGLVLDHRRSPMVSSASRLGPRLPGDGPGRQPLT